MNFGVSDCLVQTLVSARVYFRPLKKGVVLPLAIVKGVELPLEHIKKGVATPIYPAQSLI